MRNFSQSYAHYVFSANTGKDEADTTNPANNYLFKVNNRNNGKRRETCSKLTIKSQEPCH